jgi:uncharacterized membrane protein/mono/diheme cytochrome c family protein
VSNLEPNLLEFVGRLHLLLVHFPIALVLTGGFVELFGRGHARPSARSTARWCLGLGAAAGVLAVASGWIHAGHVPFGRSQSWTLLLHRSAGIAATLAASMTWLISRPPCRPDDRREGEGRGYRIGFLVSCALVGLTGHLGASLVHGKGFLLAPFLERDEVAPVADEQGVIVENGIPQPPPSGAEETADDALFAQEVEPILAARCYECHGPKRQKGRLRLDQLHALLARPGQTIVVPGNPDASEVILRVELPADDLDVMPAKGEPLTPEQIETLRAWIAGGARLPANQDSSSSPGEPPARDD